MALMLSIADLISLAGMFPDLELCWLQGPLLPQHGSDELKVLFRVISPWKGKLIDKLSGRNGVYLTISEEWLSAKWIQDPEEPLTHPRRDGEGTQGNKENKEPVMELLLSWRGKQASLALPLHFHISCRKISHRKSLWLTWEGSKDKQDFNVSVCF